MKSNTIVKVAARWNRSVGKTTVQHYDEFKLTRDEVAAHLAILRANPNPHLGEQRLADYLAAALGNAHWKTMTVKMPAGVGTARPDNKTASK